MRCLAPFRSFVYAALVSGLLFIASCHRADVMTNKATSAQDAGQGDEKNAACTNIAAVTISGHTRISYPK